MRNVAVILSVALSMSLSSAMAAPAPDALSRMFDWWNGAFKTPGAYTPDAFRQHFTDDAALVIDGIEVTRGVAGWAEHFQRIQAGGGEVEIVVPFKDAFQSGDKIYSYHVIRSRRDGVTACMLAAGHAELRAGKIAVVSLVRAALTPEQAAREANCWK